MQSHVVSMIHAALTVLNAGAPIVGRLVAWREGDGWRLRVTPDDGAPIEFVGPCALLDHLSANAGSLPGAPAD